MNTTTATTDYHCSITANTSPQEAFDKIARVPEWKDSSVIWEILARTNATQIDMA